MPSPPTVHPPRESSASALEDLFERTAQTVEDHPLCAAQVAVAHGGRIIGTRTFGRARFADGERDAKDDSLFALFSVTKAITSAAVWLMLQDGKLSLEERVADRIPEFASHGKDSVTVEQLLTHTAGFPTAVFPNADWSDPARRRARFASWALDWAPGSRFVYHPSATMWVLAELVTQAAGIDYRDLLRERIFAPLGLRNLFVGLPDTAQSRVAEVVSIGEPMTAKARAVSPVDAPIIAGDAILWVNEPANRRIGNPGGGAIGTAADVALLFQGLLADASGDGPGIWRRDVLADAWTVRNPDIVDPMTDQLARRGLGVVLAGDAGKLWRGFPKNVSRGAFGHMGAGGQIAWADPETGPLLRILHQRRPAGRHTPGRGGLPAVEPRGACARTVTPEPRILTNTTAPSTRPDPETTPGVSVPIKLAFGVGQLAEGVKNAAFGTFLLLFYNQALGLSGGLAGTAIFIALCFDAVTDPIAGSVSDNFQSRWGRRHPFMVASALPLAIAFFCLFSPPAGLSSWGLFAWLTTFTILSRAAMTLYHVPPPGSGRRALGSLHRAHDHRRLSPRLLDPRHARGSGPRVRSLSSRRGQPVRRPRGHELRPVRPA